MIYIKHRLEKQEKQQFARRCSIGTIRNETLSILAENLRKCAGGGITVLFPEVPEIEQFEFCSNVLCESNVWMKRVL